MAVDAIGAGILLPLMPLSAQDLGATPVMIGLLLVSLSLSRHACGVWISAEAEIAARLAGQLRKSGQIVVIGRLGAARANDPAYLKAFAITFARALKRRIQARASAIDA